MDWALKRQGAVLSGSAVDQCCMRLQGLPYECKKEDVEKFLEGNVAHNQTNPTVYRLFFYERKKSICR